MTRSSGSAQGGKRFDENVGAQVAVAGLVYRFHQRQGCAHFTAEGKPLGVITEILAGGCATRWRRVRHPTHNGVATFGWPFASSSGSQST